MGEAARKIYPEVYKTADDLLAELKKAKEEHQKYMEQAEKEIRQVREKWLPVLESLETRINTLDRKIKSLAKKNRSEFFSETERVELANGALLYHAKWRVKRARGVLERLEGLGMTEAIKVSKSVKWDVLEKWPDEKLFVVGTERVLKEDFSYELY